MHCMLKSRMRWMTNLVCHLKQYTHNNKLIANMKPVITLFCRMHAQLAGLYGRGATDGKQRMVMLLVHP